VDDVIQGVTLQLLTEGSSSTVTVGDDADATSDLLGEIVEAYNDIVEFVNENDTIERVEDSEDDATNIYGSLAKTRTDNDFLTQFRFELIESESANGTSVKSMSEIGISTNKDGTLDYDADDFKEAIADDSLGVLEVLTDFADATAGITGFMYDYTKLNGLIDIAQDANDSEIKNLNDKIDQLDRILAQQRTSLEKQFTALEVTMSELQNQQAQLSSVLAGLQ
jgi:flagellar hook-associated protein 2